MPRRRERHRNPVLEYRRQSSEQLLRQIEEARGRGDLRAAIDMAKELHRREPRPDRSELLGRLEVERAQQLMAKGLYAEAAVVLGHAMAHGHAHEGILRLIFECGLRSGQDALAAQAFRRMEDASERARAQSLLADELVVRGDVPSLSDQPVLREDATRIRRAFEAFERGDDSTVAAELRDIGLASPCAGWKWLLMGLTAWFRGEPDRALACWTRSGIEGRAARLARLLQTLGQDAGADDTDSAPPGIRNKVLAAFAGPRLTRLQEIKAAVDRQDPEGILEAARRLIAEIPLSDREAYALRLGRALTKSLVDLDAPPEDILRRFGRPPEDPRLVRVAALALEREEPVYSLYLWREYLKDVRTTPAIPEHLRPRAEAMVWRRMGRVARRADPEELRSTAREHGERPLDAVTCYRESIRCHPEDVETHQKLIDALLEAQRPKEAERQAEEVLKRWPSHVPTLLFLAKRCFERDAVRKALKYFERARQAEPFNVDICREMAACYLLSARRRLARGHLELAREDHERAQALLPAGPPDPFFYCQWAGLEWRAGNETRAEDLFNKAVAAGRNGLPVYYAMAVEAARASVPESVRAGFEAILATEWNRAPTVEDAVGLVDLDRRYSALGNSHPGQRAHRRHLVEYLRRARKRLSFPEDALLAICAWLKDAGEWWTLIEYVEPACSQFPGNYFFPLYLGHAQLATSPRGLPARTVRLLNRAGELAVEAGDLETASDLAMVLIEGRLAPVRLDDLPVDPERLVELLLGTGGDGNESAFPRILRRRRLPRPPKQSPGGEGQMSLFDETPQANEPGPGGS